MEVMRIGGLIEELRDGGVALRNAWSLSSRCCRECLTGVLVKREPSDNPPDTSLFASTGGLAKEWSLIQMLSLSVGRLRGGLRREPRRLVAGVPPRLLWIPALWRGRVINVTPGSAAAAIFTAAEGRRGECLYDLKMESAVFAAEEGLFAAEVVCKPIVCLAGEVILVF